jgi:hypothetical protein
MLLKRRTMQQRLTSSSFQAKERVLGLFFTLKNCLKNRQMSYKFLCIRELDVLDPWMALDKIACLPISVSAYFSVCRHACLSLCVPEYLLTCMSVYQ